MVWEKNLVPTEDDMKEIQEREYEFENASDMLARWICGGGEITDDIFEKAYKEINLIFIQSWKHEYKVGNNTWKHRHILRNINFDLETSLSACQLHS